MKINCINSYQNFRGFVNIKGVEKEATMVNTSNILGIQIDETKGIFDIKNFTKNLIYKDMNGQKQSISSASLTYVDKKYQHKHGGWIIAPEYTECKDKQDLYNKFSKEVAKICAEADKTGKILDIVL